MCWIKTWIFCLPDLIVRYFWWSSAYVALQTYSDSMGSGFFFLRSRGWSFNVAFSISRKEWGPSAKCLFVSLSVCILEINIQCHNQRMFSAVYLLESTNALRT